MLSQTQYFRPYGTAIAAVLVALLIMLALDPVLQLTQASFLLFFGAVTISAFYGGQTSGVVATLLSAVVASYFFLDVQYSWTFSLAGGLRLSLFIFQGLLISTLAGSLRVAQAQLRQSFQQLKTTEAEVKDLNRVLQHQVDELENLTTAKLASEDRYRLLFKSIDEGFCLCEMLLSETGTPIDYRFLEVNPVFESLTGLSQPVGKTARELVPNLEEAWFETYGRVALERQPLRFEQQSVPMQRWFDVYAFPFGEPQRHLFGILFRNITARKDLEQEREQFLAVGSDLQVITGRNGYFKWVSPTFERVLGWTTAEITARPWTEFVHPDDIAPSVLEAEDLFLGQETFAFENRYRHKDGSYRWLFWRAQLDPVQQVLYGAAVDITESKHQAANAAFLAEIATEFSRLVSADEIMQTVGAKIGAYLNLAICSFTEINDAETEAVINYAWHAADAPNIVGVYRISDFVTDDFRQAAHHRETIVVRDTDADPRTNAERYAELKINSFVSVPCHQDGQWKFLLNVYDSVPRNWRDDEIELIRELAHQIFPRLEQARMEAALQESEARFRSFAENSKDVIWITDVRSNRLVYVSPSYEQVWGRSPTAIYDDLSRFGEAIHPDDRDRILTGFQQCTQGAFNQEYRIIRPDGTIAWIRDRGFPIYDDQGQLLWIGGIAEDISERKRDEAARQQIEATLQQREAELRLVTNAVPSLISFIDSEQRYRFNNHTYEEWFGQPVTAAYGKHLREVLGEAAYEKILPYVEQVLAGQQVTYENELPYQDGGMRYVSATYVPRFNHQGKVAGFVALVNDVSDRKRSETALRDSEYRFRRLVESNMFGVAFGNFKGEFHYANDYFLQMVGKTREELEAGHISWVEMTPPEYLPLDEQAAIELRRHGVAAPFEKEYIHQDGSRVPILIGSALLHEPSEENQEIITFYFDLTERKHAENALRQALQKLNFHVENTPMGVIEWDGDMRIARWSKSAERIFGWPAEEVIGKSIPELQMVFEEDVEQVTKLSRRLVVGEEANIFSDNRNYTKSGNVIHCEWYNSSLRDASGHMISVLSLVLDVTDKKRVEAEREQLLASERASRAQAEAANRVKDEFLAVVSHELRSPLNPILGWSKLLRRGQLDEQKTQYALEVIERNTQIQAQLINDLLDVSRILRGKLSLKKRAVHLEVVVQAALETVRLAAEAKSIYLHTVLEPAMRPVSGDLDRLQQVVWNLLSNAVKFTPEGGLVEVRLAQVARESSRVDGCSSTAPPAYAQLTISDTGKGIHPDFLPHVFDRFRQESTTTTREFGGLGLGLALVRYLVELHGGSVEADSPGEGQGAIFTVKLPLLPQTVTTNPEIEPSKPSTDLQDVYILVVDDDASTLEFMVFLLELHGANVMAATSVDEAIAALAEFTPDILLSDIGMPNKDGYTLMRQVRTLPQFHSAPLPAIALTAYAGEIDYQQAMAAGFQKHMPKPVEPEQLIAAIAVLVKQD